MNSTKGEWNRRCIEPRFDADDLSFGELTTRYNFDNTSDRALVFTRLVVKECLARGDPVRVLDIGCGKGIELCVDYQWAIREYASELWGLEPDPGVRPTPGLFDRFLPAPIESADLPQEYFDVAYSFMVMEHVSDPMAFMRSVVGCLKPGGVYIFATPNGTHYFTRIASALHALRLDERVLRLVKGRTEVEGYHYPVRYRFNSERQINELAASLSCSPPAYVYVGDRGLIGYFPRPLRFIYHTLQLKRRLSHNPRSLISMICRIERPH